MKRIADLSLFCLFIIGSAKSQTGNSISLFKPEDRGHWYVFLQGSQKGNDSLGVFQFENGVMHVSGQKFGYIATEESYSSFHLKLEFKWGVKKYPPRENEKRDAGILYNVDIYNGDKIWPRSLECQIQEGDCGDIWLIDSAFVIHADTMTKRQPYHRVFKSKDAENPTGEWNKVEVIVNNGDITYLVNGQVVNKARNPNPKAGRIMLQSEGAEIYYRNVELQKL
ncbi:MAG: DUF1080 domain-containing protein [Bacteroidia bacterium]|nr:DUF1080 domain-containing protein [Bacteroidia bacterium]